MLYRAFPNAKVSFIILLWLFISLFLKFIRSFLLFPFFSCFPFFLFEHVKIWVIVSIKPSKIGIIILLIDYRFQEKRSKCYTYNLIRKNKIKNWRKSSKTGNKFGLVEF